LLALYDGNCALCKASKEKSNKLDWLGRIQWISLQEYEKKGLQPSFRAVDLRRELHLIEGVKVYKGFFAARKMLLQFPLTILPALLLYIPFASLIGIPIYNWIARNRYKWMGTTCEDGSCSL
jgi:predicted DCC family thiol-disulfide oxidoreductase YuxK